MKYTQAGFAPQEAGINGRGCIAVGDEKGRSIKLQTYFEMFFWF